VTESLPLFPLHTQLLPQQRLDLQIFEPRYLQLVKDCLRADSPFGVVMIREGAEVVHTSADVPQVFGTGVSAKIVDWGTTNTSLLAVTIIGQAKFKLSRANVDASKLMSAEISWLPVEAIVDVPIHHAGLLALLQQLRQHPATARLQLPDITDARHLGWQLSQLLPLPKSLKVDLLSMVDPLQRLDRLLALIEDLSEGR
tara:strand:+ start:763 stop:1359 length:597 start_codon:yes stop_codon:yes gene_type:complete